MTKPEIIDYLRNNLGSSFTLMMANEAGAKPTAIDVLMDIAEGDGYPENWRAAWVIDHIWQIDPNLLLSHFERIVLGLTTVKSDGVKRHFMKIVSQGPLEWLENGNMIDVCIHWLTSQQTPIATRAHCMEAMRRLTLSYPELRNELIPILEEIAENGSKGEKNKARKTIAEIEKRQKQKQPLL
jgi:hypothetical protein